MNTETLSFPKKIVLVLVPIIVSFVYLMQVQVEPVGSCTKVSITFNEVIGQSIKKIDCDSSQIDGTIARSLIEIVPKLI